LATSAFALESQFLWNGAVVPANSERLVDSEAENVKLIVLGGNTVTCKRVTGEGFITGPKTDLVTKLEFKEFKGPLGVNCTMTMDNLPWLTELTLVGTVFLDFIKSDGVGTPGWKAVCLGVELLCEWLLLETLTEDYSVDLTNEGTKIDAMFLETEEGNCFENGTAIANDAAVVALALFTGLEGGVAVPIAVSEA
jgi:hypothetical protein